MLPLCAGEEKREPGIYGILSTTALRIRTIISTALCIGTVLYTTALCIETALFHYRPPY